MNEFRHLCIGCFLALTLLLISESRAQSYKLEQLKSVINVDAEIHSIQKQLLDSGNPKETKS